MQTKTSAARPAWALMHKKPGTELRLIKGRYYLYGYKTVYDKDKKRPRKVSGPLLGTITEKDGFIPSSKRSLEQASSAEVNSRILCREYGVSRMVVSAFAPYSQPLQQFFPEEWKEITAIAYCRFVYRCPLKSIPFRLASSYLPELLGLNAFGEKYASGILNRIGGEREKILRYMKSFITAGEYMLMDATDIFSASGQIELAKKGYNSSLQYDTQFNLMYIYSAASHMPVYYRLVAGNIREVKAFKNSLLEAGLQQAVIIADKGFYSQSNVSMLMAEALRFILPLKRDNALVSYTDIANNTFKSGASFFEHEKRPIWYKIYNAPDKLHVFLYLDEQLRIKEDADYLRRIKTHPESYTIEEYHHKKDRFGTIALLTGIDDSPGNIYETYKSRMTIEVMFDSMKNVLDADHTYMQNEQTLQGWMFINHLALQWYQHLYIELKQKNLLKQISVNDYIQLLADVKKICINNQWYLNEFTAHTQKLIDKLKIKLT